MYLSIPIVSARVIFVRKTFGWCYFGRMCLWRCFIRVGWNWILECWFSGGGRTTAEKPSRTNNKLTLHTLPGLEFDPDRIGGRRVLLPLRRPALHSGLLYRPSNNYFQKGVNCRETFTASVILDFVGGTWEGRS